MYIICGILIGIILGLTGAGGGILSAPILHFIGIPLSQAVPIGLIAIACSSSIAAAAGIKQKIVRYKAALLMACFALPFSFIGVNLAKKLPQPYLLILFACIMLIVAMRLIFTINAKQNIIAHINPKNGKFYWNVNTGLFVGGIGSIVGFLSGLLGVGGGFIIVPLLKKFTNLSMHSIIATSLTVSCLISLVSVYFTVIHGIYIPLKLTVVFSIAVVIGMLAGRKLSVYISEKYIQYGFAVVIICIALSLIIRNLNFIIS